MEKPKTKIQPFPLGSIAVTDEYSQNAVNKEIDYLLSLDEGRLLAGFYENAGLKTPFVRYGGWENTLIGGHTLGHVLTALAQGTVNANVGEEARAALLKKSENLVNGLAECQAHSQGEQGFVWGALPIRGMGAEAQFDNVEQGKTDIVKEAWVPYYTLHKLIAGLLDCYRFTGSEQALAVAEGLGGWVFRRSAKWNKSLLRKVLCVEYGGMNDCLYELYAFTGKEDYAVAAHLFDEEELFDEILSEKENALDGKHANTTIPKILGALNRYLCLHGKTVAGERINAERYLAVAEVFFRTVTERHTYATGGNSEWEHFGRDRVLDGERTNCNCETCNVYNMLKLARVLYCVTGKKQYIDYYENAYFNSILSSQNPETGMTTYFQPMASGYFKVFGERYHKFWCCTGSGMESFTKLGDSLYYYGEDTVYVAGYCASRLHWKERDLLLTQQSDFPFSEQAVFKLERAKNPVTLCFRIPDWAKKGFSVLQNGAQVSVREDGEFICLRARAGDEICLAFPCSVTAEKLPDADAYAFLYGGKVLSADLGREDMKTTVTGVDVTIPARKLVQTERIYFSDLSAFLRAPEKGFVREGETLHFTAGDIPLIFGLHYRRYRERYAIYWYLCEGERRAEEAQSRTVCDAVQAGYGQYENDPLHEMQAVGCESVTSDGTYRCAKAGGYFCYDIAVERDKKNVLSVCLCGEDGGKPLKITAGGETLFDGRLAAFDERLYRKEFLLPDALISRAAREKTANGERRTVVSVRFEGNEGEASARVCEFLYLYCEE